MEAFDFVVIGAGSAGCVLANRLSANREISVLLLEAGGPDNVESIHTPGLWPTLLGSERDWIYETTPQVHCNNRRLPVPRGKMYGGSSSINAMIYQRGCPADYDGWARLGNEGWSWEDVVPYFKKSQHQERGASDFQAIDGPQNVADIQEPNPLSKAFVAAAIEAGYPNNPDFNDGYQEGFGFYQFTQKHGRRYSAAVAYLHPALKRKNLTAVPFAHVLRLDFEANRCCGATYFHDGIEKSVRANQEVIVCGGAINSPQLLMLSGIGSASTLSDFGIKVVQDLPGVGQNLQDHILIPHAFEALQPVSLVNAKSADEIERYNQTGRGMLTSNIAEAGGFVGLGNDSSIPEVQFHFLPTISLISPDFSGLHGFTMNPGLVHVESVGELTIQSDDPFAPPLLNPRFLSAKADRENLLAAFKISRQIANQSTLDGYRGQELLPGPEIRTNDDILAYIRETVGTIFHPAGTCKMGQDPMSVVNDRLQVHGIQGLRVADVSIMPTLINANINAPAMMIGEKCADLILESL